MPVYRVDSEALQGISVEFLDAESIELTISETDWSHKRIAVPCNSLLPSTLLWAKELPVEVAPTALIENFPRIANLLAANWKDPRAFYSYMRGLLTDSRGGGRQGFPSNIKEELVKLRMSYDVSGAGQASDIERESSSNIAPSSTDSAS
jgi:hypothetical protein